MYLYSHGFLPFYRIIMNVNSFERFYILYIYMFTKFSLRTAMLIFFNKTIYLSIYLVLGVNPDKRHGLETAT